MRTFTCIVVSLAGVMLSGPLLAQKGTTPAEVVFVCEHGAAKSVIAAAHFNKIARERGLTVRAVARGTNPDLEVAPRVVAGLKSEGATDITAKPQLVTDRDVSEAKRVVTLGCKLPQNAKSTDWNDIPSPSADYGAASSVIRSHVEALVGEFAAAEPGAKGRTK